MLVEKRWEEPFLSSRITPRGTVSSASCACVTSQLTPQLGVQDTERALSKDPSPFQPHHSPWREGCCYVHCIYQDLQVQRGPWMMPLARGGPGTPTHLLPSKPEPITPHLPPPMDPETEVTASGPLLTDSELAPCDPFGQTPAPSCPKTCAKSCSCSTGRGRRWKNLDSTAKRTSIWGQGRGGRKREV